MNRKFFHVCLLHNTTYTLIDTMSSSDESFRNVLQQYTRDYNDTFHYLEAGLLIELIAHWCCDTVAVVVKRTPTQVKT